METQHNGGSHKTRTRHALLVLMLCAGAVVLLRWESGRLKVEKSKHVEALSVVQDKLPTTNSETIPERSGNSVLQIETLPQRRDADFWPQQAHPIALLSREVLPSLKFPDEQWRDPLKRVWLVQLGGPLEDVDKIALGQLGVEPLFSGAEMTFYMRATAGALSRAAEDFRPSILGWVALKASDKILLQGKPIAEYPARMRAQIHPGASLQNVAARAQTLGAAVVGRGADWLDIAALNAASGPGTALELAALDDVYLVEPSRPAFRHHDEEAADASNATVMRSAPFNLDGSGVTVMVRDEGRIFAHPDFGSRLQLAPDVATLQPVQHATHVAGTIGGSGQAIPGLGARGFATGCSIVSYDLNGDESTEVIEAKNVFGAQLSNHSYGVVTGWNNGVFTDNQATFGTYSTFARNLDSVIRNENVIIVKSAGNDRADSGPGHPHDGTLAGDGEYYNTVDQTGTSKNVLCVGAAIDGAHAGTPSAAQSVLPFSSSGPTIDGRLRPELIANGDSLLSCDNTPVTGNVYVTLSGTSMAAAAVTGASALFLQRFRQKFGNTAICTPHYLRAVYAQTATDFGRAGPDYLHGFGMLDLSAAVSLLDADGGSGARVLSASVSSAAPERWYEIVSDGVTPIRATLCWSDDAGDALARKALVNDLDLRLVRADSQNVVFPFILNPAAPDLAASTGVNQVDTIEQVLLQAPAPGNYLLSVRGSTLVTPVNFVLASSHLLSENKPPIPVISSGPTTGAPTLVVSFDGSASSDPDGTITRYVWTFGDGSTGEGAKITHTYGAGTYTASLKVFDNRGASASTQVSVSVDNKPPSAQASASPASGVVPLSVMFTALGSIDTDGVITAFDWDFGDGTTGTGLTTSHTFAARGLYWPVLTLTDNAGATTKKTLTIFAGDNFQPSASKFAVNFAKNNVDSFSIATARLEIPADFAPAGHLGMVRIGMTSIPFLLDAKGVYNSSQLKVTLNAPRSKLSISMKQSSLASGFGGPSALNVDTKNQVLLVPFAVTLDNGMAWGTEALPFSYTGKKDKSGSGRLLK